MNCLYLVCYYHLDEPLAVFTNKDAAVAYAQKVTNEDSEGTCTKVIEVADGIDIEDYSDMIGSYYLEY